ncbi:mitochondrial inner membrane protein required for protein import [Balamuthia mandrillaris]
MQQACRKPQFLCETLFSRVATARGPPRSSLGGRLSAASGLISSSRAPSSLCATSFRSFSRASFSPAFRSTLPSSLGGKNRRASSIVFAFPSVGGAARQGGPISGFARRQAHSSTSSSTTTSSFTNNKTRTSLLLVGALASVTGGYALFATNVVQADGKGKEDGDKGKEDSFSLQGLYDRIWGVYEEMVHEAGNQQKQLLPDPVPPPYGRELSLVISDDLLLKTVYEPKAGGLLPKKRPATEYFLASVASKFECVLWSRQNQEAYYRVIQKLDPNNHCHFKLFKDSTNFENKREVKDLARLGRDLKRVIAIDTDYANVKQKENTIVVEGYDGSDHDQTLLRLIPFFLIVIQELNVRKEKDVRPYVKKYQEIEAQGGKGYEYFRTMYLRALDNKRQQQQKTTEQDLDEEDEPSFKPATKRGWW